YKAATAGMAPPGEGTASMRRFFQHIVPIMLLSAVAGCGQAPIASPIPSATEQAPAIAESPPAPALPIVGRWRGSEAARDELGPYEVEAWFDFAQDGTVSAEMEFPDPIGRQHYSGDYRLGPDKVLELRLNRWGETPRKFRVSLSDKLMTWEGEKGEVNHLMRVKK
ncbi:MAG: hypothetical protein ACHQ5A_15255, partial [Opitutales bacterium]